MLHALTNNAHTVCAASLISVVLTGGLATVPAYAQMSNVEVYEHVVKPQEEKRAGEVAAILARKVRPDDTVRLTRIWLVGRIGLVGLIEQSAL